MEYDNCIDCDQYFFDDMKCIFEEDNEQVEDDEVIDYDVFVMNERNLQKEIARLLLVDSKEKPHITARKVDNLVNMYMALYNRNFAESPVFERMGVYFRPVVSMKRCIHTLGDKEKTKMQYVYDVNNVDYESIEEYIDNMTTRVHSRAAVMRPFVKTGRENAKMLSTLDSIYKWKFGQSRQFGEEGQDSQEADEQNSEIGKDMLEPVRLLSDEAIELIGLVNVYGNEETQLKFGDVNTYYEILKALKAGDIVKIVPHDDIAGLTEEDATVIKNDQEGEQILMIRGSTTKEVRRISLSSIGAALKAPFTLQTEGEGSANTFCKRDLICGRYLVRFDNPEVAEHLAPTLSEWLYCHESLQASFFTVKDAEHALPSGVTKGVSQGIVKHIINRNINRLKKSLHARKPFNLARKIYRAKAWSTFLNVNNKVFKHEKSSIDTQYHRAHFINKNQMVQTQLLRCIEGDLSKSRTTTPQRIEELQAMRESASASSKAKSSSSQTSKQIEGWLKEQKDVQVHNTLERAINGGDGPRSKDDIAYVWNSKKSVFIALTVSNRLGGDILTWAINIDRSAEIIKDVTGSKYDASTFRVVVDGLVDAMFAEDVLESLDTILDSRPVLPYVFGDNVAKNQLRFDHTSFLERKEYQGMNAHEFTDMEGDDEYVDYEREMNNREFGVAMMGLDENQAYEDDEAHGNVANAAVGVAGHGPERKRVGVADIVYRVAHIFEIDFDESQINFIAQHTNLRTNCDQEIAGLKAYEFQMHTTSLQRGWTDEMLEKAKAQLAERFAPRYEAIYDKVAFHLVAMFCVVIQAALPRVIISPQQQYAKEFGLEGHPLNNESDHPDMKTSLLGYLTTLMMKNMFEMSEFKSLVKKYSKPAEVKAKLVKAIDENILINTPLLVAQLDAARVAHRDFKSKHQQALDIMSKYAIWTTFRPYFDIKNVENKRGARGGENNLAEITAKYIAIVQRIVEKAQPIKVSIDKIPLQVNSCCTQPLISKANFWNYFNDMPEVRQFLEQYRDLFDGSANLNTNKRLNNIISIIYDRPDDVARKAFRERDIVVPKDNMETTVLPVVGVDAQYTGRVLVAQALREFMSANPLFADDMVLSAVAELPMDQNVWSRLSTETFALFNKLSVLSDESLPQTIKTVRDILLDMNDEDIKGNTMFASTIAAYLSYDMKHLLGKISNDYHVNSRWENKHKFTVTDKLNIHKSLVDWLPNELYRFLIVTDFKELKHAIQEACINGLKNISVFESIVRANGGEMVLCYLLLYILAKTLLQIVAHHIDYSGELLAMDLTAIEIPEAARTLLSKIVEIVIQGIINKHNHNIVIETASHQFEKSREQGKQDVISYMKGLDANFRDLIKDMKERGLVNLLDLSKAGNGDKGAGIDGMGDMQDNGGNVILDERENEIVNDIRNNMGENADDDEYDG